MKKIFTFFILILSFGLFLSKIVNAQTEVLVGGNMELNTSWMETDLNSQITATVNWNYTDVTPTMGEGGCLNVSATIDGTDIQQSQYAIYQEVSLSSDIAYEFDGAFRDIGDSLNQFWCEAYIGIKPVDGEDYNGANGTLLAQFNTWNGGCNGVQVDGTFKMDGCHEGLFIPDTSGNYFFVLKFGNNDYNGNAQIFNVLVDELSLIEKDSKPLTDFGSNIQSGYAPLAVQFVDKSPLATTWAWDFGDGNNSTEQNPLHTYTTTGIFTVTLTAGNSIGDSTLIKENYIVVNELISIPVDGVITGGNMEDVTPWEISYLNTPVGSEPTVIWNYTLDTPGAGEGGCLYVSGAVNNYQTQYCIYQPVTLSNDKVYTFNGAFKDISENITNSWVEVFVGTQPVDGEDYGTDQLKIASFSTWDACTPAGIDGVFSFDACYLGSFVPDTAGKYFFVLKVGINDWESTDRAFDILLDQLSLIESDSKPYPAFSADNATGFAPFTVNFIDKSKLADSWLWNFGDGNTSIEQNPAHTFNDIGMYTISLTVSNEQGDSTITKENFITVNENVDLPEGEKLYGGNMEESNLWTITNLNATSIPVATWNYTDDSPIGGVGGNLHVTGTVNNTTSHYCIWQAVELKADSVYTFDALFKDINGVDHFWCEVFIGTEPPVDGSDYGEGADKISYFNTWEGAGNMVDGSFSEYAINPLNPYQPATDSLYYFVLKLGNTDWESTEYSFEVLIDELSLKESAPVILPTADFFADLISGDAPLTVQFYNTSLNAIEYNWDFGDGSTSNELEPSHTYTRGGVFSVTLIAKSLNSADTLIKEDLITVEASSVFDNYSEKLSIYPNPSNSNIIISGLQKVAQVNISNITGSVVKSFNNVTANESLDITDLTKGMYFVSIKNGQRIITFKIVRN